MLSFALFLHTDTLRTDAFLSDAAPRPHPELSQAPHWGPDAAAPREVASETAKASS